jgi:serine protease Do
LAAYTPKIAALLKKLEMNTPYAVRSNSINISVLQRAIKLLLLFLIVIPSSAVLAQSASGNLQLAVQQAIKKAYPASVRLWGFDVEKNERNSGQFSGVVVSKNGLILTAAHTVAPGRTYKVFFTDGHSYIAKALGRIDLANSPGIPDVGMLQIIENGSFPFAELGYSSILKSTSPCISISYPEKLNQVLPTIRFGQVVEPKNQYGFIQSSCKMEPGDSGGPLFDIDGKVIGIHSAIDVAENMNFEIPIDVYRKYWTALHEEKNYTVYPTADSLTTGATNEQKYFPAVALPAKIEALTRSTRLLRSGKSEVAVTLINFKDAKGKKSQWMVGKSSLLGDSLQLVGEEQTGIEVIARSPQNDLVLLKAGKMLKGGYQVSADQLKTAEMGTFVTSLFHDGKYERSIIGGTAISLPKSSSIPYLGISVLFKSKPAMVSVVKPGSPAALAGIKTDDLILAINGIALQQASDFTPTMEKFWAGEQMQVTWSSAGKQQQQTIQSIARPFVPSNHPVDRFAGGSSARRDGFDQVFVHDAVILPTQCGAPIVDAAGNLIGITIARYSRAVALGLPTSVILDFIEKAIHVR